MGNKIIGMLAAAVLTVVSLGVQPAIAQDANVQWMLPCSDEEVQFRSFREADQSLIYRGCIITSAPPHHIFATDVRTGRPTWQFPWDGGLRDLPETWGSRFTSFAFDRRHEIIVFVGREALVALEPLTNPGLLKS